VDAELAVLTYHARLHIRRGDLARAADVFRRIDDLVAPNPEAYRDRLSAVAVVRVEFDLARGDVASAHARADALLAGIDYPRKRNVPILKALLPPLTRLALLEHHYAQAQAYATEALTLAQSVARPGGHSADVGEALLLECESLQHAGHRAEARREISRAVENLEDALGREHSLTREAKALQAELARGLFFFSSRGGLR
jgi:Flp pilus assembly protein TadD